MAEVIDYLEDAIECGYCLQQNDQLVDPRELPCSHVYCYPCLVGDFETRRIVKCGMCRLVFDVTLARLSYATISAGNILFCDTCVVKGTDNQPANIYCTSCNRKMCTKHEEFHKEFHPEHKKVMNIQDYKQNMRKLEVRFCTKHKDEALTMGCTTCYKPLCVACMDGVKDCTDVLAHQAVSLDQLIKQLENRRDEVKAEARVKEEKLSDFLKLITKVLSQYDIQTEEMIKLLHTTRDEQISEVHSKYDELEAKLVEGRKGSKEQIIDFMEREVGVRLTEINTVVLLQDAIFRDAHQIEVVDSFSDTTNEIKQFVNDDLPSLTLTSQKQLKVQAEYGDVVLKLVGDVDMRIDEKGLRRTLLLPTSLRLKKAVKVGDTCRAVSSHRGVTYVCHGMQVSEINESDFSLTEFKSGNGICLGVSIGEERLYVLSNPSQTYCGRLYSDLIIHSYALSGVSLESWKLIFSVDGGNFNNFAVVSDKVVVLDRADRRLTLYTLNGQLVKHIPFLKDNKWTNMVISSLNNKSVVVSSIGTSQVFRVNIDTEKVMWTSSHVPNPGGITCYGEDYVLVSSFFSPKTEIFILDAQTGQLASKLECSTKLEANFVPDLQVSGNMLIVARFNDCEVLYYELMFD